MEAGACGTRIAAVLPSDCNPDPHAVWSLVTRGCEDVQIWSDDTCADRISNRVSRWLKVESRVRSLDFQKVALGQSVCWIRAMRRIAEAALYSDAPVLLTGETGTGKEVVARAMTYLISGAPDTMRVVDCATLSPDLIGSELFGHERGAFTGATSMREGAIALADGGVLFLDEIGELPIDLQAQFLRVLQEGTYRRLGGNTWRESRFRLICATNRNLETAMQEGRFRSDLYHRIAALTVHLPPLADRPEDIIPLSTRFVRAAAGLNADPVFDPIVRDHLLDLSPDGNVRALQQLCRRIAVGLTGTAVSVGDLIAALPDTRNSRPPSTPLHKAVETMVELGRSLAEIKESAAEQAVTAALRLEAGSVSKAARRLGITPRAIHLRRSKHDV
ncbi:sigma 54-interacting transcriptional regulator [Pelagibius sp. Alg239-R121]|uniref:sigma 54-interacting transcriptional regulator n=1 Tax=Pelagibius sp. Alg239-R121 TaxID=2993448 RepID=UPI0024A6C85B|nr:sigma 54-interacting transcriptional regulator [Pelagibius sp. Alg239-R121]